MSQGMVVLYAAPDFLLPRRHEIATHTAVAQMIAEVLGYDFGGVWTSGARVAGDRYFVPYEALLADEAMRLGIRTTDDFFGGMVPFRFVHTKAITHGLVSPQAERPAGWSEAFSARTASVVLPGYTAFGLDDAREAARRLLADGPVRVKPCLSAGSRGQAIVQTVDGLDEVFAELDDADVRACGVVLETNLSAVRTLSVGQVNVRATMVSYVGTQRETADNEGAPVYGGSELTVVRGPFRVLESLDLDPATRRAAQYVATYDRATRDFPRVAISRRNYDVAAGIDPRGRPRFGVLEASWRVGGASGAEIAALRALAADPDLCVVRVSTTEAYGPGVRIPDDALVHFDGVDDAAGRITRYTRIEERRAA